MKIEINTESLCQQMHTSWIVAHSKADDCEQYMSFWGDVDSELHGIWLICLHSVVTNPSEEGEELLNEIQLLRRVAELNKYDWSSSDFPQQRTAP